MRWLTDGEGTFIKCTMKELHKNLCRAFGVNEAEKRFRHFRPATLEEFMQNKLYENISEKAHDFNRGMKAPNDFSDSQYS